MTKVPTARDICTNAYRISGLVGLTESPSANQITFALDSMNRTIAKLANKKLWKYNQITLDAVLTGGQTSFTIGPTGDFVGQRPFKIISIKYLKGTSLYPIGQISNGLFNKSSQSTVASGDPYRYSYFTDFPNGTIRLVQPSNNTWNIQINYLSFIDTYDLND